LGLIRIQRLINPYRKEINILKTFEHSFFLAFSRFFKRKYFFNPLFILFYNSEGEIYFLNQEKTVEKKLFLNN